MKYIVIEPFRDGEGGQTYDPGSTYPKRGRASKSRLEQLSTDDNGLGYPVIEPVINEGDE